MSSAAICAHHRVQFLDHHGALDVGGTRHQPGRLGLTLVLVAAVLDGIAHQVALEHVRADRRPRRGPDVDQRHVAVQVDARLQLPQNLFGVPTGGDGERGDLVAEAPDRRPGEQRIGGEPDRVDQFGERTASAAWARVRRPPDRRSTWRTAPTSSRGCPNSGPSLRSCSRTCARRSSPLGATACRSVPAPAPPPGSSASRSRSRAPTPMR